VGTGSIACVLRRRPAWSQPGVACTVLRRWPAQSGWASEAWAKRGVGQWVGQGLGSSRHVDERRSAAGAGVACHYKEEKPWAPQNSKEITTSL